MTSRPVRRDIGVTGADLTRATDAAMRDAFDLEAIPNIDLPRGPVVVLIAHNEARRLDGFLRHHRSIGVVHFIVVDNASTDGTAEMLDAADDVTRIVSTRDYEHYVRAWRGLVADRWLTGRWVLFPDADECLIYPGWPELALPHLLSFWDGEGVEAVHGTMIDMYSDLPMRKMDTSGGPSLLALCPYFDMDGYWSRPLGRSRLARYPVPSRMVMGGARRRVMNPRGTLLPDRVERWLRDNVLPLGGSRFPMWVQTAAHRMVERNRSRMSGHQSKLPVVKWQDGLRFERGPHCIDRPLKLAEEWCALLHFKLIDDLPEKAAENIARGQHSNGARGYAQAMAAYDDIAGQSLLCPSSRMLRTWRDLNACRLMPVGDALGRSGILELRPRRGGTGRIVDIDD